jgi:hypothetical protein
MKYLYIYIYLSIFIHVPTMRFFLFLSLFSAAFAYETTVIEKPGDGDSQFGINNVLSNDLALLRLTLDDYIVYYKDLSNGDWLDSGQRFTHETLDNGPSGTPESFSIKKQSGYITIGTYTHSSTIYVFRVEWDPLSLTYGVPVYSTSTFASQSVIDHFSPNGELFIDLVSSTSSTTIQTYYWTGSNYVSTGETVVIASTGSTINTGSIGLTDSTLILGEPSYFLSDVPANTKGRVTYRDWNAATRRWIANSQVFFCPSTSAERKCFAFGDTAWVSGDLAVIGAPEAQTSSSRLRAGAVIVFKRTGGVWDSGTISHPDANLSNGRRGAIVGYDNDNAVILSAKWLQVYGKNAGEITPNTQMGLTAARPTNLGVSVGGGTVSLFLPYNPAHPYYGVDYTALYNLDLTAGTDGLQSIPSPYPDVRNANFGSNVRIVGDYMAITSQVRLPEAVTSGTVSIYKRDTVTGEWGVLVEPVGPGDASGSNSIGFGIGALDFDGATLVVGATGLGPNSVGGLYVYDFDGTSLSAPTILFPSEVEIWSYFGLVASVKGNILVVGQPSFDQGGILNSGVAWVFTKAAGAWGVGVQLAKPGAPYVWSTSDAHGSSVSTDGTHIVVCSNAYGTTPRLGLAVIHTYSGSVWEIQEVFEGQAGAAAFARSCAIDGAHLAVTGDSGSVDMFKETSGTWAFHETVSRTKPPWMDSAQVAGLFTEGEIALSGKLLLVGSWRDTHSGVNSGSGSLFTYDGSSWMNGKEKYIGDGDSVPSTNAFRKVSTDGASIAFNSAQGVDYELGLLELNVGKVGFLAIFEKCVLSADCRSGQYCGIESLCVPEKPCSAHHDCIGEFRSGRLPFCYLSKCEDRFSGDCVSETTCSAANKRIQVLTKKLGAISQNFTKSNVTVARAMVKRLYTDLKSTTAITQEIDAFVAGTEYATLPMTLFTDYANTPALLAHIRSIVCPPEVIELCAIEIPDDARRRVLDEGSISVEITYTINSALFESLAVNGTSFSDGSAFEEALAALLGVNSNEISLSAVSGKLVIEYVVTEEAVGDEPLSEANLAALQAVRDELAAITAALLSELGLDPADVSTSDIDFCSGRDCNGRGTCDADTGVCFCTDTDYWGINCETVVNCNGGTKVPNEAYCACEYPEYGQRCAATVDCLCA